MEKTALQAEMLANRVKKRLKHLQKWAKRSNFEAFRLYDRDIPEIPLVLDLYGSVVCGALYKRPYEKAPEEEALWLETMRASLSQSLNIAPENIIIKQRERQRGENQYEKIAARGLIREIREGSLKFKVNLSDYLDTGLFLDRRSLRALFGADAKGKRVLNLFCYTASFSVYAAAGGAVSTDSVDLSNTYLDWARENFALNGFKAERLRFPAIPSVSDKIPSTSRLIPAASGYIPSVSDNNQSTSGYIPASSDNNQATSDNYHTESDNTPSTSDTHRLIRSDVNVFLDRTLAVRRALAAQYTWDSIILDPPAFSNSSMTRADFDLARDYVSLLAKCLALLSPAGKLWFSANAKSFKASAAELEMTLNGAKVTDISDKVVDEDFKGRKLPKTYQITVKSEK